MAKDTINSLETLYKKVLPALHTKKNELARNKMSFVNEKDIWNCLRKKKWNKTVDLTLFDIVNDILNLKETDIMEYISTRK